MGSRARRRAEGCCSVRSRAKAREGEHLDDVPIEFVDAGRDVCYLDLALVGVAVVAESAFRRRRWESVSNVEGGAVARWGQA